jgi:MoaA/NifB/PqqE/SkfB family radical SAM enzyme/ubiquinone/menaquinone biosynthesis C-methylase UbiE
MNWQRLWFNDRAVYVHKTSADWFVPNAAADALLQRADESIAHQKLLSRIAKPNPEVYTPALHVNTPLHEFWIHVTNRCNLSCSHCLFSSSPKEKDTLSYETMLQHINEAYSLGCRLFVLSGGEPLVYPKILELIEAILSHLGTSVVILTNGLLLEKVFTCKDFERSRVQFQISLDGLPNEHDAIRGKGSFEKLKDNLAWLTREGYTFSLSTCVHPSNVHTLEPLLEVVKTLGATHLHLLWHFLRGRDEDKAYIDTDVLFEAVVHLCEKAQSHGIVIDNIEALKTQVFAPKGTVHDGSSSGRSSIALGYDGTFYPSAAMVGEEALRMQGASIKEALESDVAKRIAEASVVSLTSPFRFILGGGDLDHSFSHAKTFMGDDPYERMMEKLSLWLITQEAQRYDTQEEAMLCLEMGDILYSCGAHEGVAHTHANCLIATGESASLSLVKSFYHDAALADKEDILNPICYEESYIEHIPHQYRFRGYGCGSPILEANLTLGESMVDLGSGRGIECFIASKLVGKSGQVIGVDMLDSMLSLASEGAQAVSENLGFNNLTFKKGYLESMPLNEGIADVITSNCVLNLSTHKRKLFAEIFRVLKEGGRLVVSDVVCDEEASALIRNDAKLSGECIAGALTQTHLVGLLRESGFERIEFLKRFFYREVKGHTFYSLSFRAYKPKAEPLVEVIYKGVGESLHVDDTTVLFKGVKTKIPQSLAQHLSAELFILDDKGNVSNQEEQVCACAIAPEEAPKKELPKVANAFKATFSMAPKQTHNCMVCKTPLVYATVEQTHTCHYCGETKSTSVTCKEGHYVCDACHSKEALVVIEHLCESTQEKDMLKLFKHIRSHPSIPKHGPEHHAMVPAIIVTTYKNSGGSVPENALKTALSRGSGIIGGSCGFLGMCGAASGVGIGFAILLQSSPVTTTSRQAAQQVTHTVLGEIATYEAARCCNREVWTALSIASKLSETFLHVKLEAMADFKCDQKKFNQYCYGKQCPIF